MAKVKKADNTESTENESVDSILGKIKNMVTGKEKVVVEDDLKTIDLPEDEEPLELSDVVESESEGQNSSDTKTDQDQEDSEFVDILKEIDSALVNEYEANQAALKAAEEASQNSLEQAAEKPTEEVVQETEQTEEPVKDILEEIDSLDNTIAQQPQAEEIIAAPLQETKKEFSEAISNNIVNNTPIKAMTEKPENILSQEIADKSSKAIQNLLNNIPRPDIDSPAFRSANTLEDLVMEILKPMMKDWLDNNLEVIVRDIVEREIRKIIPRE
jgi:cell pole-organizing protein PopZ